MISVVYNLLDEELATSQVWMNTHISDHSAMNYQGQVLKMLLHVGMHPASKSTQKRRDQNLDWDGGASDWAWNLLSQSMEDVKSSRFVSHEVTWIRRRMCGLECLRLLEDRNPSDFRTSLDQFIESEVKDLAFTYLSQDSCCQRGTVFALSYIVWIIRKMKCLPKLWNLINAGELEGLEMEVIASMACNDTVPGNYWRRVK